MRIVEGDARRLLDCLGIIYHCDDVRSFRTRLIPALQQLIPSDVVSLAEIDVAARVAHGFAEPAIPLASWAALARHALQHPIATHYQCTRDPRAFRLSDFVTLRQLRRGVLYAEALAPLGVDRQIAFAFDCHPAQFVGIALSRRGRDFSERERLLLNLLQPHAAAAYRSVATSTLLRPDVRIERCRRVAGHLDVLCAPLRTQDDGEDVVGQTEAAGSEPAWTVFVHEGAASQHTDSGPVELTVREREVLDWVAKGKTNADTARILRVSARTVQKHLERIFEKLGVENRTAAAARLRALTP